MPFARVDTVSLAPVQRLIPVEGGRFGDGLGASGHTFQGHKGVDIFGGDGSRTVRAASDCEVIRLEDARASAPDTHRGAAGPFWVDVFELDTDGKRTDSVLRYLHLDTVDDAVKVGAKLDAGDRLGTYWPKTFNGGTGHLHFEVRSKDGSDGSYGDVIDPVKWLQAKAARPRVARLVCMLRQEEAYAGLKVGQALWPRSAVRVSSAIDSATAPDSAEDAYLSVSMKVETLPRYPFLTARVIGQGEVRGEVTASLGEALNWVAIESTAWSFRRWGLGYPQWKLRVAPLHEAALKNAADPSVDEARRILAAVASIRGETPLQSVGRNAGAAVAEGAKQAAGAAAGVVKDAVGGTLAGIWEGISTEVKVAAGVVIVAGAVALASSSD